MPFRHVVMFRWAAHVDHDHVDRVRAALDGLARSIPGIRGYVHGSDVGVAEGNFDYVVVADFDDVGAWRAYRDHPTHLVMIEELITGHVAERAAVQYQIGPDTATSTTTSTAAPTVSDADAAADTTDESDDELLARARRAAMAEMQALLAEPE